jgi:hypothetical protein
VALESKEDAQITIQGERRRETTDDKHYRSERS